MKPKKLKLYVWDGHDVLPDYTSGMICVYAYSITQALKLIEKKYSSYMNHFPVNDYKIIRKPEAFAIHGGG